MTQAQLPSAAAPAEEVAPPRWRPVVPRTLAAVCLVATAALSAAFVALQPEWPDDHTALLATVAGQPGRTAAAGVAFALSQLFLIGAVLAIGDLARSRAPRLIGLGMLVTIVGAFGHTIMSGLQLAMLGMLPESGRAQYADALDRTYGSSVMLFAVVGLLGTVLGLVLLAMGLRRAPACPLWIPACLVGFVVLEFIGSALSPWASVAAVTMFAAALVGLTIPVLRSRPAPAT